MTFKLKTMHPNCNGLGEETELSRGLITPFVLSEDGGR
jgi:hypothetical protein